LLVGGVAGNGQFTLSGGTDTFSALVTVGMGGTGTFTETGGTATFAKNLTVGINESGDGTFGLTGSGAAIVTGQVTIGADKGVGTFNFNSAGGSASLQGSGSAAPAFEVGVGGTGFLNVYGGAISASDVGIGSGGSGDGRVEITGSSAKLSAATIEIGGFKSGNSVSGGVGDLVVSDGGYVSDAKTLTLQDYATVNSSGNPVFSGTIFIFDGSMEVGGHGGGLASGTLQIDSGGVVVGHGQIEGLSSFNTIVAAGGKLEASAGVLEVDGNVSGRGTIQIDANSKLEITSAVSAGATITFQAGASAGLELDDAEDFAGTLTGFGKTTTQFINLGDVASGATVKLAYTPNSSHPTSSGVLTVSSGGGVVATISMIGAYVTSNFHLGNATDGSVLITDPPVAVQSANAALLGNYVAASFVSAAGGIGGVVLTEPAQTANVQPSLTHPHTG
jgi:hypothetical protein